VRSVNGGEPPWDRTNNLLADLWALWANSGRKPPFKDHPVRAEKDAAAKAAAKKARVIELRAKFEKRKRSYGLG